MSTTSGGLVKRTSSYDADVLEWLQQRGEQMDRSVDWQIRQILRAAMQAEQREPATAAAR